MQQSESGVNPQAKVTEIEKAWLAGIIDGEGSLRIDYPREKGSASPRIIITNNDWALIEKVVDICQRIGVTPHVAQRKGRRSFTKDVQILNMTKLLTILPAVMPYLTGQKEKQAIILFNFCKQRKELVVNSLSNGDRTYTKEQINMIYEIQNAKHKVTEPQRLYARQLNTSDLIEAG